MVSIVSVRQHAALNVPASAFNPVSLFSGGKAGVLFDVSDLSTLFFDRSATPSTPASVDGLVGTILDKSGNGNHAIAPSDAARGTLRLVGATYRIQLDTVNDCYAITNVAVATAMSSIVVFNRATAVTHSIGFGFLTAATPYSWWWFSDNKVYGAMGGTQSAGTTASTATGDFVGTTVRNASTEILRRNGVEIGTRTAPAVAGNLARLGMSNTSFALSPIYAAMLIATELTGADLANAETWFGAKAGLTL